MGTSSHFPQGAQVNYPSLFFLISRPLPHAEFLPCAGIAEGEVEHGVGCVCAVWLPTDGGVALLLLRLPCCRLDKDPQALRYKEKNNTMLKKTWPCMSLSLWWEELLGKGTEARRWSGVNNTCRWVHGGGSFIVVGLIFMMFWSRHTKMLLSVPWRRVVVCGG